MVCKCVRLEALKIPTDGTQISLARTIEFFTKTPDVIYQVEYILAIHLYFSPNDTCLNVESEEIMMMSTLMQLELLVVLQKNRYH